MVLLAPSIQVPALDNASASANHEIVVAVSAFTPNAQHYSQPAFLRHAIVDTEHVIGLAAARKCGPNKIFHGYGSGNSCRSVLMLRGGRAATPIGGLPHCRVAKLELPRELPLCHHAAIH